MLLRQGFSVPKKVVGIVDHATRKRFAMSKNNAPSLDKYLQSVKDRGYDKLPVPTHQESIAELIAEGDKLLAAETKTKKPIKKTNSAKSLESSLAATDSNPYIRARAQILKAMPGWRQREIETMEASGDINNRFYEDFVKSVTDLGNQLSSK